MSKLGFEPSYYHLAALKAMGSANDRLEYADLGLDSSLEAPQPLTPQEGKALLPLPCLGLAAWRLQDTRRGEAGHAGSDRAGIPGRFPAEAA